ncbi:MAG: hypothetical protein BWY38_03111 [Ignavibacteria bacterium ADurb.Bin266]|nr:MAG: hypothetical protein BWY38_03111 [Ignavibacteria bacterium ADurb.Bin266]
MNISSINGIETKNIQRINKIYTSQIKSVCGAEISMKPFKTLWSVGAGQSITLPLVNGYSYDFFIDWGDGISNYINSYDSANRTHTYSNVGEYIISIKGICEGWNFQTVSTSKLLITKVLGFGEVEFKNLSFYNCNNLNEIRGQINGPSITNFTNCFNNNSLTLIPIGLFNNCTKVTDFGHCFRNNQLTSIPEHLFDNCTQVTSFYSCFGNNQLTSIPENLFDKCVLVTNFSHCFGNNQLTSIPENLFDKCVLVTNFSYCFYINNLTSIPENLFENNTLVTNFSYCFANNQLTSIPISLFDNNTLVESFDWCFYYNNNLKLNKYIFYSEGQQSTRFLNQSVNFQNCFSRDSYVSPDAENGEAPDLWNCDFGTGTPTKTGCFRGNGNNAITLTNYTSIPSEWK